jgi:SSS family solute:Na+ symporter
LNLTAIDWAIVLVILGVMMSGVLLSRGYMRSVADFLSAGRSAGRYILSISQWAAGLGAISIIAFLQMNYVAGFSMSWWGFTMNLVMMLIAVSGWVIYRFRETRCLTLAEFFERRYSRPFRVFAGLLAFLSGLINFGIFPAVGTRFFIHFCGLPPSVSLLGLGIPTFPLVMLLGLALFFVFSGGQIVVIVTNFLQGLFVGTAFLLITLFLLALVGWDQIFAALGTAPADASLINPFKTSQVKDFNFWYFLIGVFGNIYGTMSWQGTQGYNSSARTAHEAKMSGALSMWRGMSQGLFLMFVPIVAYTVMHHPEFVGLAARVDQSLSGVEGEAIRSQLRIPLVLVQLLPAGLMGAFAAVMLAAFLSTHESYLHSWGSIFVQDVLMPFRKRPFTPRQHLRTLRLSIAGVAVFIFFFSLLFQQSEYILLFFAITGAIFLGGSGAVIIGGLYWKWGTAPAAWAAMVTGAAVSVGGIVIRQFEPDFFINGQVFFAISMGTSVAAYMLVSLLGRRRTFDLDRLLRRGAYRVADDHDRTEVLPARGWRVLGMGREFSRGDRVIYIATYVWTGLWTLVFILGTVYNLSHVVADALWIRFWQIYVYIQAVLAVGVIIWFAVGGIHDMRGMFRRLGTAVRDQQDDGRVRP